MERVPVDEVESVSFGRGVDRRGLSDPLGTTDLAVNRYRLPPGERISGLHAHLDQEEVFLVVEGEVTFETFVPAESPDGVGGATAGGSDGESRGDEFVVGRGEAVRFAPGEYQSGRNDGAAEAVVYALGAPRESEDVRIPLACPACGRDGRRPGLAADGETPVLACPDCGRESAATCPECGSDDMLAVLEEDGRTPVGVCRDCGAEAEG